MLRRISISIVFILNTYLSSAQNLQSNYKIEITRVQDNVNDTIEFALFNLSLNILGEIEDIINFNLTISSNEKNPEVFLVKNLDGKLIKATYNKLSNYIQIIDIEDLDKSLGEYQYPISYCKALEFKDYAEKQINEKLYFLPILIIPIQKNLTLKHNRLTGTELTYQIVDSSKFKELVYAPIPKSMEDYCFDGYNCLLDYIENSFDKKMKLEEERYDRLDYKTKSSWDRDDYMKSVEVREQNQLDIKAQFIEQSLDVCLDTKRKFLLRVFTNSNYQNDIILEMEELEYPGFLSLEFENKVSKIKIKKIDNR